RRSESELWSSETLPSSSADCGSSWTTELLLVGWAACSDRSVMLASAGATPAGTSPTVTSSAARQTTTTVPKRGAETTSSSLHGRVKLLSFPAHAVDAVRKSGHIDRWRGERSLQSDIRWWVLQSSRGYA